MRKINSAENKVRVLLEEMASERPTDPPTPINSPHTQFETTTTGGDLRVTRLTSDNVVSFRNRSDADRNSPPSVVSYGHNVFSSESEFPENLFTIE